MVRLPRLVALLRKLSPLSELKSQFAAERSDALDLAKNLLNSDDLDAENALLHRVNVFKTLDGFNADLVSHSFVFASVDEMEAAVLCWMCRVHITRLCLNLSNVECTLDRPKPDLHARMSLIAQSFRKRKVAFARTSSCRGNTAKHAASSKPCQRRQSSFSCTAPLSATSISGGSRRMPYEGGSCGGIKSLLPHCQWKLMKQSSIVPATFSLAERRRNGGRTTRDWPAGCGGKLASSSLFVDLCRPAFCTIS